jgi:hypothetical protein
MNAWHPIPLRKLRNPLYDSTIRFRGRAIFAPGDLVGFRAQRAFAGVVTRELSLLDGSGLYGITPIFSARQSGSISRSSSR